MAETPKPKSQTPTPKPKPKPKPTDEQPVEPGPQQSTPGVGSAIGGFIKKGVGKLADNIGKRFGSNAPQPGAENKPAEGQKGEDNKKDPGMEMLDRYMKLVEQWQGVINKPFYWVGGKISAGAKAGASYVVDSAVEWIKNKLAGPEEPKPSPNSSTQQSSSSSSSSSSSTTPQPTGTQPTTGSTQPTTGSTQPTTGSTQPTTDSTQPTTGNTQPTTDSTQPTTDSTQPTTDSGSNDTPMQMSPPPESNTSTSTLDLGGQTKYDEVAKTGNSQTPDSGQIPDVQPTTPTMTGGGG
ncbi:TPA: hypothetical protein JA997_02975 [Legionella pneumophila]|uniref:hypothetical protein n=1 Tax=Legionella pneumophila TaxID=446 RepID=UPI001A28B037|nr:hypothetical protein [Legionella pneumophila]MCZ4709573.1 hypothetical protein [Legionella pneumophila]HAT8634330.1 hypothetical protein [Legionella pneumophila]HCC0381039.1 hypothetical protein [Legionella pneumophila]